MCGEIEKKTQQTNKQNNNKNVGDGIAGLPFCCMFEQHFRLEKKRGGGGGERESFVFNLPCKLKNIGIKKYKQNIKHFHDVVLIGEIKTAFFCFFFFFFFFCF